MTARGGLFFHRHDFLSTVGQALGFSVDLRTVIAEGAVIGAVPILHTRRGPLTTVRTLPAGAVPECTTQSFRERA